MSDASGPRRNAPSSRSEAGRSRSSRGSSPQGEAFALPTGQIIEDGGARSGFEAQAAEARDLDQMVQAADPLSTLTPTDDLFQARDAIRGTLVRAATTFRSQAAEIGPFGIGSNVVGIGIGPKMSMGSFTGDLAVQVFVQQKVSRSELDDRDVIDEEIDGIPTDVVESARFEAQVVYNRLERPTRCGSSIGHFQIGSGTLGCLIPHESEDDLCYILSNNHVLANANLAAEGDQILQPGRAREDPPPRQELALLARFVRLSEMPAFGFGQGPANRVDAALALTRRNLVDPRHHRFSINPTPVRASPMLNVCKEGRTTGFTSGRVFSVGVETPPVRYLVMQNGRVVQQFNARFVDQIVVTHDFPNVPFSLEGDSGSLVVTLGTKQPVGLLFAGGAASNGFHQTLVNPIEEVMRALNFRGFLI